jgi:hypothetical protein
MYMSPKVSTDLGGHVGPSPGQVADWPQFGSKSTGPWCVSLLEGDKGSTDFTRSVWSRTMADQPCGGRPTIFCHRTIATKLRNCPWDTINTTLRSPLEYTYSTVGYPLVKALVL